MGRSFCANVQDIQDETVYPNDHVGLTMVILGCLYLLSSFVIIYFIKAQERFARLGNDKAVQAVIFPIFVYVLWLNAGVNVYAGLVAWAYNFQPIDGKHNHSAINFAIMWGLEHTINEGVAFMLMQKGLGINAAKRAMRFAAGWGIVTLFMQLGIYLAEAEISFILSMAWNLVLWAFYMALWLAPKKRLYRRPAALFYSKFWVIFRLVSIASSVLYFIDGTYSEGNCLFVFGTLFPYVLLQPAVLYYTLLLDSRWWQGFEIVENKRGDPEDIRSPLQGMDLDFRAAQTLAASMDDLGIRTLRKGKKPVKLLNFAYISIDSKDMLGCGSFSKVYRGKYRERSCAIKLIFTLDLTPSVIRRIAAEALILSKIRHPNVVEIVGVSVLPPSVCILLELCEYGSLADVIAGTGPMETNADPAAYVKDFITGGDAMRARSTRRLGISWADRLYLALGCARGLSALHHYSTGLCHRDVKSFNFLVDAQLNAKISDLELGITDDNSKAMKRRKALVTSKGRKRSVETSSNSSLTSSRQHSSSQSAPDLEAAAATEDVIAADEFLANWAAPEVIQDGIHSQPSDVYSLGLVLWELLASVVPFSDLKKQDDIRHKVLMGVRPTIPSCFLGEQKEVFEGFLNLITRCWGQEPQHRPTIATVVSELEGLYKQRCHGILHSTDAMKSVEVQRSPTRGFSLWSSTRNSIISINREQITEIWAQLRAETEAKEGEPKGNCLDRFEDRDEPWLLVANDPALSMLWASTSWTQQMSVDLNPLLGKPLRELELFAVGEAQPTDITVEQCMTKLRQVTATRTQHLVIPLQCAPKKVTADPRDSIGSNKSASGPIAKRSIFALHAFPIVSTLPRRSSEIAISISTAPESDLSPLSRLR